MGQAGHRVDALALSYSLEGGGWRGSPFKVRSCHCTQGSHNVTSGEGARSGRSGRKGRGPGSSHGLEGTGLIHTGPAGYSLQSAVSNVKC